MVKKLILFSLFFLLLLIFLPTGISSASATNTLSSCSNQIISPGQWTGKITRTLTTDQVFPGMEIIGTVYFEAQIQLNVTCNNVTSGYFYVSHDDFSDIAKGKVSHTDVCHAAGTYTITQGSVTGTPTHPLINVTATVNYTTINCPSFPSAGKVPPVTFSMPAQSATSNQITGSSYDVNGSMSQIMANLEKVDPNVIRVENWVLNLKLLEPDISNLSAQFRQFFLASIPLQNTYSATVDWKNNPPGHVNWTINNQTTTGTMNGDVSTQSYELSQLPPGQNPLTAIAISPDGNTSPVVNGSIIMVPLDPWAIAVNFHANPQGDKVIYSGVRSFPRSVLQFFVDIPSGIPFIGGKWGLLPTQFNINLSATSLGGDKTDIIEGHSGFAFGKDAFNINVNGQSSTVLTADSLTIDNTKTVANLLKETKTFSQQASLLSVVPLASSLFNVPI